MEEISIDLILDYIFAPAVIFSIMAFAGVVFLILSIVLLHHWRTYNAHAGKTKRMMTIYFIGAAVLFGAIFLSAVATLS